MIWTHSSVKHHMHLLTGRMNKKTCQMVEDVLMSQRPSISSAELYLWMSSCICATFYEEVGGMICSPATIKPFILQNIPKAEKYLNTHYVGIPSVQLAFAGQLTE